MFCEAHGFEPGDRVAAIINGRRRSLTIVGVALSPEYVYAIRPGELFPDNAASASSGWVAARWRRRSTWKAASTTSRFGWLAACRAERIIASLDRLIEPYGGLGACRRRCSCRPGRSRTSCAQLQTFGFFMPADLSRRRGVHPERRADARAGAAAPADRGAQGARLLESGAGVALHQVGPGDCRLRRARRRWPAARGSASAMIGLYNEFFRFPVLDYRLSTDVAVGVARHAASSSAALGAQSAVRRAVRIPPAEAMRPEPPARYRRSVFERPWRAVAPDDGDAHDPAEPGASAGAVARSRSSGIAFAVAVLFVGLAFIDVMDELINQQFILAMRQDATVTFVEPRSATAVFAVAHLPGVMRRRADAQRAGAPARRHPRRGRWPSPACRRRRASIASSIGGETAVPAARRRARDVADAGRYPRCRRRATRCRSRCSKARARFARCRSRRWSTTAWGCRRTCSIDALRRLMREGGVVSGAAMTRRPGRDRALLRGGESDAGGRRRGAARDHAAELPRDDGARR